MGDEVSSYLKIYHLSFVCAFIHINIMSTIFIFIPNVLDVNFFHEHSVKQYADAVTCCLRISDSC